MTARCATFLLAASLAMTGCTLVPLEGDRLFKADRLEEAESSYRNYLNRHSPATPRGQRALYHLSLIYALPQSPLHDSARAEEALTRLIESAGSSHYGRQAAFILALREETERLRRAAEIQATFAALLEEELERLATRAAEESSKAGEQEDRAQRLTDEIGTLRAEIAQLTAALEQRRLELERIKEIDLERLP